MKIVAYDCRDHPDPRYRAVTMRLIDGDHVVLQSNVYHDDPVGLVCELADRLGIEAKAIGEVTAHPEKPAAGSAGERKTQTPAAGSADCTPAAEPGLLF